ncbi:MAG TPA: cobyrinic acid a,c-diamide synthase [Mycobacteriales bacterium]|jgi:hypothetical protein
MNRRPSLPGAAELFRTTTMSLSAAKGSPATRSVGADDGDPAGTPVTPVGLAAVPTGGGGESDQGRRRPARRRASTGARRGSGRQRHEEKITVYCSAEELLDLESARLALRADHDLVVDRGRMVREAVAVVLADLEAKGEDSVLVRRLRES